MIAECKCSTTVDALLNVDTNKVMCQNCGEEIENISEFMKNTMKSTGQIIRNGSNVKVPKGGMLVECTATPEGKPCGNKFPALLEKKDEECYCPKCKSKVNLAGFAKALLRENGQYVGMVSFDEADNFDPDAEENNGPVVFDVNSTNESNKLIKVVTVGTAEKPATVAELNEAKANVEAPKRKRGRPPKVS